MTNNPKNKKEKTTPTLTRIFSAAAPFFFAQYGVKHPAAVQRIAWKQVDKRDAQIGDEKRLRKCVERRKHPPHGGQQRGGAQIDGGTRQSDFYLVGKRRPLEFAVKHGPESGKINFNGFISQPARRRGVTKLVNHHGENIGAEEKRVFCNQCQKGQREKTRADLEFQFFFHYICQETV